MLCFREARETPARLQACTQGPLRQFGRTLQELYTRRAEVKRCVEADGHAFVKNPPPCTMCGREELNPYIARQYISVVTAGPVDRRRSSVEEDRHAPHSYGGGRRRLVTLSGQLSERPEVSCRRQQRHRHERLIADTAKKARTPDVVLVLRRRTGCERTQQGKDSHEACEGMGGSGVEAPDRQYRSQRS